MSNHAVSVELFYGGTWHAAPAYVRDGIALSRGAPGEGQESPPSTAALTLDDRTGVYGPLSTIVSRNTPMRVSADGSVRSTTELGSRSPDRNLKGNDAWAKVSGGGILRRLQQGKTPLKSPLERATLAAGPVAFWPLSEGPNATQFSSGLPDGTPLVLVTSIATGEVAGGPGTGGTFPNLADTPAEPSYAEGQFDASGFTGADWALECMVYIASTTDGQASSDNAVMRWYVSGTRRWQLNTGYDETSGAYVSVFGGVGASNADVGRFEGIPLGWSHVSLRVHQVGGDALVELYVNGVSTDSFGVGTRTITGVTVTAPTGFVRVGSTSTDIYINPSTLAYTTETASLGMVAFYDYAAAAAADSYDASTGYAGELAGARFVRVLTEEGVPASVVGDPDDTQPLGPQQIDTLVNIARECVRTDDGLLFEPRDDRELVMRTGRSLRNQDPVATLSFTGGFAPGFVPVIDDANTRNDITAQRPGGGSYRAIKTTGPLNVSDPVDDPDGVGRYDTTLDVNPASDEALVNHAHWALSKGTVDEPRYPTVTLDLEHSPALIATVDALDIGDRVDIGDLPTVWALEAVPTLLLGVKESYPSGAGDFRRKVTLNLAPYSPYEELIVGDATGTIDLRGQRVGTELSTVDGAHTSGDATILIDSAGIEWTTNADDFDVAQNGGGLYLLLGRELVRVTSVAGAGSAWTLTVVRAVNGVVGTIADGTPVRFRYPGRLGL